MLCAGATLRFFAERGLYEVDFGSLVLMRAVDCVVVLDELVSTWTLWSVHRGPTLGGQRLVVLDEIGTSSDPGSVLLRKGYETRPRIGILCGSSWSRSQLNNMLDLQRNVQAM